MVRAEFLVFRLESEQSHGDMAGVAENALQNLEEAIRAGRTDVIVATLDIAAQRKYKPSVPV